LAGESAPLKQLVGVVDIGFVVFAVMELKRACADVGFKGVWWKRKVRKSDRHGRFLSLSGGGMKTTSLGRCANYATGIPAVSWENGDGSLIAF
jgi:hypothetical protein